MNIIILGEKLLHIISKERKDNILKPFNTFSYICLHISLNFIFCCDSQTFL